MSGSSVDGNSSSSDSDMDLDENSGRLNCCSYCEFSLSSSPGFSHHLRSLEWY